MKSWLMQTADVWRLLKQLRHYLGAGRGLLMATLASSLKAAVATIDPALGPGEGFHHKRYAGWTKEQLEPVWAGMVARANVLDPIPLRR